MPSTPAPSRKQLHELNQDRQQTERDMVEQILAECERVPVTDARCGVRVLRRAAGTGAWSASWRAASSTASAGRPSFWSRITAAVSLPQGSARSVPGFHMLEALESMPDLFTKFGGHKQAAGMTLTLSRVAEFRRGCPLMRRPGFEPDDFRPTVEIEAPLYLAELNDAVG